MRPSGRHDSTFCHCSERGTCAEVRSQAGHEYLTQAGGWSARRARDGPARAINNDDCWFPLDTLKLLRVLRAQISPTVRYNPLMREDPQLYRLLFERTCNTEISHWVEPFNGKLTLFSRLQWMKKQTHVTHNYIHAFQMTISSAKQMTVSSRPLNKVIILTCIKHFQYQRFRRPQFKKKRKKQKKSRVNCVKSASPESAAVRWYQSTISATFIFINEFEAETQLRHSQFVNLSRLRHSRLININTTRMKQEWLLAF